MGLLPQLPEQLVAGTPPSYHDLELAVTKGSIAYRAPPHHHLHHPSVDQHHRHGCHGVQPGMYQTRQLGAYKRGHCYPHARPQPATPSTLPPHEVGLFPSRVALWGELQTAMVALAVGPSHSSTPRHAQVKSMPRTPNSASTSKDGTSDQRWQDNDAAVAANNVWLARDCPTPGTGRRATRSQDCTKIAKAACHSYHALDVL